MRQAVVAGMFYESDPGMLDSQIKSCFTSDLGPGLPGKKDSKKVIKAAVVPHAGYPFSGPCAAWAYKAIAESRMPSTFVILGTDHNGLGKISTCTEDWETPLGTVGVDKRLAAALMDLGMVEDNKIAHMQEHSIEVQLPFLQFICKKPKILPIGISPNFSHEELGAAIHKLGDDICVLASSDMTHYGANYGYIPFKTEIKEHMYNLDREAIKQICKLDTKAFMGHVQKTGATICGFAPISVFIDYGKAIGAENAKLLEYYTSGDITGDYSNSVGYAAIVVE